MPCPALQMIPYANDNRCLNNNARISICQWKEKDLRVFENDKPITNPLIVMREEFDDWAILFDPDTGKAFGLNPVGVLVWKCLDGHHTFADVLKVLHQKCEEVPSQAEEHLKEFIHNLVEGGMAGYELQRI